MSTPFLSLASSPGLLDRLAKAAEQRPSAKDLQEQRISFVFSSIKESTGVTKEMVRQVLMGDAAK